MGVLIKFLQPNPAFSHAPKISITRLRSMVFDANNRISLTRKYDLSGDSIIEENDIDRWTFLSFNLIVEIDVKELRVDLT